MKFKTKPWITPGLQKSFSIKNKLLGKFIKLKEPTFKNEAHTKYKLYRNMLAMLLKRSKHTYFSSFFQNHINDLKNNWKCIKRITSLKDSSSTVPSTIFEDNENLTNPNVSKMEVVFFKSIRKQTETTLKLKLNGKRLYATDSVKYLGIKTDENLNWHQ